MAVSVLAFVATLLRSFFVVEPDGVQRRNFLRAAGYPLVTAVTLPLVLAMYIHGPYMIKPVWFLPIATLGESLAGSLYVLTFWYQSYSANRYEGSAIAVKVHLVDPELAQRGGTQFASFGVTFGGVDVVDIIPHKNIAKDSPASEAVPRAFAGLPVLGLDLPYNYRGNVYMDCWEA